MIAIDLSPLVVDPRRGVSRALLHLLAGLQKLGRGDLRVEGFAPPVPTDLVGLGRGSLGLDAVHHVGPPGPAPRSWRRVLAAALVERRARVLLAPWARFPRTRTPVVAWIHEVPFARQGLVEGTLRTLRHRRALARAVDRATALVVPSDAVRGDLLRVHPEVERKVHVVHHGFMPEAWEVIWDETETTSIGIVPTFSALLAVGGGALPGGLSGFAFDGAYALLIGTGRGAAGPRKKGVDVFVQAFEQGHAGGIAGVVVGTAPGLPPWIRVIPDPGDGALALLVSRARVVVVPSRSEGFGYPMLEAFAAGVPVVASAAGALPEVSGGAARLVPPGDADALREAIERVATDEDLRARMIKDGKKRAQEFPVAAMARGWLRVLTKVGGIPWRG